MKKSNKTIAITGANGFLGSALTNYFAGKGWHVVALVRNPEVRQPHRNITFQAYDIASPVPADLLRGVDCLVHTAYVKYDKAHSDAMKVNLTGAKRLLKASRVNKVGRNIFISTMSAHDEAISVYGKQKLQIEKLFNTPKDTVLKCGLIIGEGGIVKQMSDFMRSKHAVPLIGGGKQPLQIVAIDDLVRITEMAINKKAGGSYVIATPTVYSYKSFYAALAKRLGIRVLYVPVPYTALQLAFRMAAILHLPLGVGEDNLKGLKMLRAMDSATDLRKLGVELKDLEQALAAVTR